MGALDVPDVANLHGALGAGGDVAQDQFEELALRMAGAQGQATPQRLLGGPAPLEGPAEQGERLVD